jgi:hypothetical protein
MPIVLGLISIPLATAVFVSYIISHPFPIIRYFTLADYVFIPVTCSGILILSSLDPLLGVLLTYFVLLNILTFGSPASFRNDLRPPDFRTSVALTVGKDLTES